MNALIAGDRVRANRTILLRPSVEVALKGKLYTVRAISSGCCWQMVDIGYHHYTSIVKVCAQCGRREQNQSPVWIPASYFSLVKSRKRDKLLRMIDEMERDFVFLDLSRSPQ